MGRLINHFFAIVFYGALLLVTVRSGSKVTNLVLERVFLTDYLLPWQWTIEHPMVQSADWPQYARFQDQDLYMAEVETMLLAVAGAAPQSNTDRRHVYRLNRLGVRGERIRLVAFPDRLEMEGLSAATFDAVDKALDGSDGPEEGWFRGSPPGVEEEMHAVWFLRGRSRELVRPSPVK